MVNGQARAAGRKACHGRGNSGGSKGALLIALALLPLLVLSGCTGLVSGKAQQSAASFTISPSSLNFGKVTAGQKSSQNVTLTNTGTTSVTIQQATPSSSQWGISGVTLPMPIAAGQSTTFSVWLNGTAAGSVTGTLTVQGDSGTTPFVLNLSGTVTTSAQSHLTLSPAALDFGTVSIGTTDPLTLTVGNSGASDLVVSVITLTGSEFGVSGITTPKTISAGTSVPVTVSFAPTTSGAVTGNIALVSNDPTNPTVNVALTGTGSTAAIGKLAASPSSLSFGTVATGTNASQNITLTNTGNAAVHISSVVAAGTGFSVTGVTTPATLNPSQTATLSVKFAPTAAGSAVGTITITSDAQGSPLTINLTGTGAAAGLSVSPATFNFGSVVDGQIKSQVFTITNTGTASLTVSQLTVSGTGYSASGLNTPATIAAGQSATFSVLFAPTTAGSLAGSVLVASNAPNSPNSVVLSGTGTAASVSITASPTSLSFGNVNAGSSSAKSVTITNVGNSTVSISQITVSAKDVSPSGITTPMTLTAGQTATLNLTFAPKAAETVTGNVTVSTSQGSSTVVAITATGVQAALTVTPATVSFGNVTIGSPNTQTLQLINPGTGVLTITQLSVTGTGFSTSTVSLPLSINPGASTTFNAQFAPQAAGSATGSISLVSNAPTSPTAVALSGTGVAATLTISTTPSSLSFGTVNTGTTAQQTVAIKNTGNSSVTISQINVSGTGYTLSGAGTPVTLTASQTLTITVNFSPTMAGAATGSVTITSNASGSPAAVALSGTGAVAVQHSTALNWTASTSPVSGYNVYRSTTSGSGYTKVNSSLVGGVSYTDSTVASGTTYYYVTTAVDGSGTESNYSNEVQAVIP